MWEFADYWPCSPLCVYVCIYPDVCALPGCATSMNHWATGHKNSYSKEHYTRHWTLERLHSCTCDNVGVGVCARVKSFITGRNRCSTTETENEKTTEGDESAHLKKGNSSEHLSVLFFLFLAPDRQRGRMD